jgi:hypothetical protein
VGWQSCWLRARAKLMKDDRLIGWADYLDEVHDRMGRKHQCAGV